jgi:hypothetical protein
VPILQSARTDASWPEDDDVAGEGCRICPGPEVTKQPDYRGRLVAHGPKENDASWLSDHSHKGEVMVAGDDDAFVFHRASPEYPIG